MGDRMIRVAATTLIWVGYHRGMVVPISEQENR